MTRPAYSIISALFFLFQVFRVLDCEAGTLEFIINDGHSFRLFKGVNFQVPADNVYSLRNHSETQEARLGFTLVKSMFLP